MWVVGTVPVHVALAFSWELYKELFSWKVVTPRKHMPLRAPSELIGCGALARDHDFMIQSRYGSVRIWSRPCIA